MKVNLLIEDYEIKTEFNNVLVNKVRELIEPQVAKALKEQINTKEVIKILEKRIKDTLSYSSFNTKDISESGLSNLLDKKLSELVQNISDEELKGYIFDRLIRKIDK